MAKESLAQAVIRLQKSQMVAEHYSEFLPFLHEGMELLGFSVSEVQDDIAKFIAYGPHYLMVQAQRGQAKTSIAALYCVWCLIQNPKYRVLIVSAGGSQASDISTLIIRIIMNMPVLAYLRPDIQNGDRSSVEHFDVHYTLKGVDKSPSVKCLGITANLQGNRADLLLADDVESQKNSSTAVMRAQLLEKTLDFTSINSTGRIVWLGTPQSMESIYNTLPGRGVTVRIWPGRYPTVEQMSNYGDALAPMLARRILADPSLQTGGGALGDQGKPIEKEGTGWLDEANLQQKELDQGQSWFQLQHMLNTRLIDALRFPLKTERIVLMDLTDQAPLTVVRGMEAGLLVDQRVHGVGFKLTRPHAVSPETAPIPRPITYIDPAGGGKNADETAYSSTSLLNSTIYLMGHGGLPGGYDESLLQELAERIAEDNPYKVVIEKNMGYGAFRVVFEPIIRKLLPDIAIEDDLVTGQKELRIINTLEPVIGRGALVVTPRVVEQDAVDCARYAPKDRNTYSLFHQIAKLTRERGSLVHDDRVDALEGSVRQHQELLVLDQQKLLQAERTAAYQKLIADPLGHNRYGKPPARNRGSLFNKHRR
jgi:hypothetical protein